MVDLNMIIRSFFRNVALVNGDIGGVVLLGPDRTPTINTWISMYRVVVIFALLFLAQLFFIGFLNV